MTTLNARARAQIKTSNFAIPSKAPGSGSYPIHDIAHARVALARVAANGTPAEQSQVRAAVARKYPSIDVSKATS